MTKNAMKEGFILKKVMKFVGIIFAALLLIQIMTVAALAENVNEFPPKRPEVGVMDVDVSIQGKVVALRTNGTVNILGFSKDYFGNVLYETDVVDVACNDYMILLLKSDGSVKIYFENPFLAPSYVDEALENIPVWTDIVAIDCGSSHAVGLKSDGTVVAFGANTNGQISVKGWRNISEIYADQEMTIGLCADGTLERAGAIRNFEEFEFEENIQEVFFGYGTIAGVLYADGTVKIDSMYNITGAMIGDKWLSDVRNPEDIFKRRGYTGKIIDIDYNGHDDYYILDEFGTLYKHNSRETKLIGKNIVNIMTAQTASAMSNKPYYCIDAMGEIRTNGNNINSEEWILTTNITYDGEPVNCDVAPYIKDGRTLAPIRAILERFGMTVTWDQDTRTATAVKGDITIKVVCGSNIAYVNGVEKPLDVPAEITRGRTFVPVRFFAEALGLDVDWNQYTKTVIILSK